MTAGADATADAVLTGARTAPVADLATLTCGAPVLVIAPHPDDESLGCGGLIAACCAGGIPVAVALLTDGAGSHPESTTHPPPVLARLRGQEMLDALEVLGLGPDGLHEMGWPDQHAPRTGTDLHRAVAQLVALVRMTGARTIVAAWRHDPHCDHEAAAVIAAAAARITRSRHLAYPVWGWMLPPHAMVSARTAWRLDIARHLPTKRRAVACHRSQHGQVITDSAGAFALPADLLAACLTEHEVFFDQGYQ